MKLKCRKIFKYLPYLCILTGILCMAYPCWSEWVFKNQMASSVVTYENKITSLEESEYQTLMAQAKQYNAELAKNQQEIVDPFEQSQSMTERFQYQQLLRTDDSGMMGYVEIPEINVTLPIYHGTSANVLERGVGHLEGTSLPVGGEDTHAVITGHTGLNQAKLLSDLDQLKEGDQFYVDVLGERLVYQVFDIETVLPEDTDALRVKKGEDLVTLVTCTPYGVNTHRLLVHGKRIESHTEKTKSKIEMPDRLNSQWRQRYMQAIVIGVLLMLCIIFFFSHNIFRMIGIGLLLIGVWLFVSPDVMETVQKVKVQALVQTYERQEESQEDEKEENGLYRKMVAYNQSIYLNGQEEIQASSDAVESWIDGTVGILEIPALDQILPIYVGATDEHMSDGVAVMQETSLPVGGNNTNCVIAGHRGYNRSKTFFKDIELLSAGDRIYIKNSWEKLTYEVESIDIVAPDDIEAIKIQPGQDMVTLLTCHPYGSHGQYRYLVFCRRVDENDPKVEKRTEGLQDHIVASDGQVYKSSSKEIQREKNFRWLCAVGLLVMMVVTEMKDRWKKRREK